MGQFGSRLADSCLVKASSAWPKQIIFYIRNPISCYTPRLNNPFSLGNI
jgi:hypothetical protein